jgi:hypothetical protein
VAVKRGQEGYKMAGIRIPKQYQDGLQKLVELENEQAERLIAALRNEEPALLRRDFVSRVASHIADVDRSNLWNMMDSLFFLCSMRGVSEDPTSEFAQAISESSDLTVSAETGERFKGFLSQILDIASVPLTAKANDILAESEHILYNARILTDIRPIFGKDESAEPDAAMIVHILKVHYDDNGEHKDFFLTLDSDDIEMLQYLLFRASEKEKSLRSFLDKSQLRYLGMESSEL